MANTPVLSPEAWEALKAASIRGVPDSQLAESFGVERNAIRQRRFLDPIWKAAYTANMESANRVNEAQEAGKSDKEEKLTGNLTESPETANLAQKVASTVSENISRLGEQNRLLALQIAGKGLKQANAAPPDVQSWQDVKALMDIVSKASGMEAGNAVQVNVLSSGPVEFVPGFGVEH